LKLFSEKPKILRIKHRKIKKMTRIMKKMKNILQRSLRKKLRNIDHENLKTDRKSGYLPEKASFLDDDISG
jgi:uncharacterized membrane protein YgaE (UPF0421/DUF939 family)